MAKPWWREAIETVIWALVLGLIIRTFIFQAFWIPSGSMIPTLEPDDRVIVFKQWHRFKEYKRGDIVVFRYPIDPARDFIKRIIGVPGDTVEIRDGRVFVNALEIAEPYVRYPDNFTMAQIDVPKDCFFCLGDNRANSQDSRFWGFVPRGNLVGPALFRYWPPSRIGRIE